MEVNIPPVQGQPNSLKIRIGGVVLCGGKSTRMGQPKAWLTLANETLLQRVVRLLSTALNPVVVVAAVDQQLPELPAEVTVVLDSMPGEGPLVGLQTGLQAMSQLADAAFVCGCDMPFVNPEVVRLLIARLGDKPAMVVKHAGQCEPLASIYRTSLAKDFADIIDRGERSIHRAIARLNLPMIDSHELRDIDAELRCLKNINTQEEYEALGDTR
jgi:molybdopterin-guanine dinucleotide biosynthesis protein A